MRAKTLRWALGQTVWPVGDRIAELAFRFHSRRHGLAFHNPHVSQRQLTRAIELGARFLTRKQSPRGRLSGFMLKPGASTAWLTAHTAFVCEDVPELEGLCLRAAKYLSAVGPEDGGWGYNRRVAPDCDSTAQALMVLHRFGISVPPFLLQNLMASQLPSGGFPTYPHPPAVDKPQNGWQIAHPEVSAIVSEALRRVGGEKRTLERCLSWVRAQVTSGVLPSYWWVGCHYGLWVQARAGFLTTESDSAIKTALMNSMEVPGFAMVATAATGLLDNEQRLYSLARMLLLQQNGDGSWNCQPCLRVTSQGWLQASAEAPGVVAADKRRVFSTAHCVAALSRLKRQIFES